MKIFITGASGFVGGATVAALKDEHQILAMARSEQSAAKVQALGATPVRCELGRVQPEHLAGVDVVIHCAAFVEQWGTREQFWQTNVEGTAQLLDVAKQAEVRRFIYIGTEAALFYGQPMRDIEETYPYPVKTPFLYCETKAEAEKRVLAANDPAQGFMTLSLRPRMIWGPGDQTVLPELVKMVRNGSFAWIAGGHMRTSTTHIHNLVYAIKLALTQGRGGQAYFITDSEARMFKDFATRYLATQGLKPPDRSLPKSLAYGLAWITEGIWKALRLRQPPPLTRYLVALMSSDCTLRIDKARQDLDYKPVISVAEGMVRMPRLRG